MVRDIVANDIAAGFDSRTLLHSLRPPMDTAAPGFLSQGATVRFSPGVPITLAGGPRQQVS